MKKITYEEACTAIPGRKESLSIRTDDTLIWSGEFPLPKIGDKVVVTMNGFGESTVVGYKRADGYLGVTVHVHNPPEWYLNNCGGFNELATFFGAELAKKEV